MLAGWRRILPCRACGQCVYLDLTSLVCESPNKKVVVSGQASYEFMFSPRETVAANWVAGGSAMTVAHLPVDSASECF
jgi:hypothetical protein